MSKDLKTPTNWPDPKRPGYPMFPDRNGEHKINYHNEAFLAAWIAEEGIWFIYDLDNCCTPKEAEERFTYYHGPVLTPAQINEMLAAERDRCAKAATEVSDTYYAQREEAESDDERVYADERMCAAQECAEAIRNLGAAP